MEAKVIIFLVLGLFLLLGSGKYLVESSVKIASHFKIPTIIIGLTVVAFGTSAPELLVSIQAAVQGHPDMALGNVVGSNISNILLVLAATTIVFPLAVQRLSIIRDWPIMMGITILLGVFLLDLELSRIEGLIFVIALISYILFSIQQGRKEKRAGEEKYIDSGENDNDAEQKLWLAIMILFGACIGLAIGADLLVKNASILAKHAGISERVISISMVALGTSLPELATSMIAAFKKETDISIGNILGSNIMNIISVLGITSIIKPIHTVEETLKLDIPWMFGASVILLLFMLPVKRGRISRIEGILMLTAYVTYIYFIFKVQ